MLNYLRNRRLGHAYRSLSALDATVLADVGLNRHALIALGGVATVPWRAREAEDLLKGGPLDEARLQNAADAAFAGASTTHENAYKVELGKRTLVRAFMEIASGTEG